MAFEARPGEKRKIKIKEATNKSTARWRNKKEEENLLQF
jgi:hypothetical protein